MKFKLLTILTISFFTALFCTQAWGHEFIVKPAKMSGKVNEQIPFQVLSAHVFMESEEIEPKDNVRVYTVHQKTENDTPLVENESSKSLTGEMKLNSPGTHILCGQRKPMIWCKTKNGWKQDSKRNLGDVISSGKYEKFSKAIILNSKDDDLYSKTVGHKLEVVPVDNPGKKVSGEEISLRILYDGKPITTEVFATYDGFSKRPNTYAYYTKSGEDGIAGVKLSHPGTWMVRVQHEVDIPTEDYDKEVLRAVLLFDIKT